MAWTPWHGPRRSRGKPAPSALREVGTTAPYMHDGSIANLCDALQPHATLEGRPSPTLTIGERRDVVAFLRTLSAQEQKALIDEDAMTCR